MMKRGFNHCPKCQSMLVLRTGKFGLFWGCSQFGLTECKGSRNFPTSDARSLGQIARTLVSYDEDCLGGVVEPTEEEREYIEEINSRTFEDEDNVGSPRRLGGLPEWMTNPLHTPVMDWIKTARSELIPDTSKMPAPSVLDSYFIGVADKHGIDLMDSDIDPDYTGDEQ